MIISYARDKKTQFTLYHCIYDKRQTMWFSSDYEKHSILDTLDLY